ncbi:hypothetical protein ACTXT7_016073 [Hymenolepis weldensis]
MGINDINDEEEGREKEVKERHNESSREVQNLYCETVVQNIIHFHATLPDAASTFNLFRCLLKHLSKGLADDCDGDER